MGLAFDVSFASGSESSSVEVKCASVYMMVEERRLCDCVRE